MNATAEADIITIAKGLTSAYAPLSGTIVSEKLWAVLEQGSDQLGPIGHGWTYSAHPLCTAAGVANLKLVDKLGLVENARSTGGLFQRRLHEAFDDHPLVGEARGIGLIGAVEIVADKQSREQFPADVKAGAIIAEKIFEQGLIVRGLPGDAVATCPPLIIEDSHVDEAIAIIDAAAGELDG